MLTAKMGCASCRKGEDGKPLGCRSNGNCGNCGCDVMTVFDWLEGVPIPEGQRPFDIVEVRFKRSRKGFYRIGQGRRVQTGDVAVVDATPGEDMGVVSLTGELVRAQMKAKGVKDTHEIKKVIRKAEMEDISTWQAARNREKETLKQARSIIADHKLDMKLGDVEYQGDGSKCTLFYTAEQRVDFRELVRDLAAAFKVRIEMRQIGARQESARIGGIGVCGRELCCSTWLTDFRSVSTGAARYQQLSLNPQKLAGQCGKLKCCLNFELDQYKEAVAEFPPPSTKLMTRKGKAGHFKTDIFGGRMWFQYFDDPGTSPIPIDLADVRKIMEMNDRGEKPDDLQGYAIQEEAAPEDALYGDVVGQDDVNRFDGRGGGRKGGRRRSKGQGGNQAKSGGGESKQGGGGKRRKKRRKGRGPGNAPSA
jgi:cell fate regulator YaaT (PSP1 superfamily)